MPKQFADLEDNQRELPIVLVRFDGNDDPDITRCSFPHSCDNSVSRLIPIAPMESTLLIGGKYHRIQLPLAVAHARTCHSVQGYTAENGVVVNVGSRFFAGEYVAISRAKCLEQVILLGPLLKKHFAKDPVHMEKIHKLYIWLDQFSTTS